MDELSTYLKDIEGYTLVEQLVGFSIGLLVEAEIEDIKALFDVRITGGALMAKPTLKKIDGAFERLESDGFIVEEENGYVLEPISEDYLPTAVYLNYPNECRTLAQAYLKLNAHLSLDTYAVNTSRKKKLSYPEARGWCMALLFTDQPEVFKALNEVLPRIFKDEYVSTFDVCDFAISALNVFPAQLLIKLSTSWVEIAVNAATYSGEVFESDFTSSLLHLLEHADAEQFSPALISRLTTLSIERLHALPKDLSSLNKFPGIQGAAAQLRGEKELAQVAFSKHTSFNHEVDFAHILSDLISYLEGRLTIEAALKNAEKYRALSDEALLEIYRYLLYSRSGNKSKVGSKIDVIRGHLDGSPLCLSFLLSVLVYLPNINSRLFDLSKKYLFEIDSDVFPYVYGEGLNALSRSGVEKYGNGTRYTTQSNTIAMIHGFEYLSDYTLKEKVSNKLIDLLSRIAEPQIVDVPKIIQPEERLIWIVDLKRGNINVKVQKLSTKGGYTRGRVVKLESLVLDAHHGKLSKEDQLVVNEFLDYGGEKINVYKSYYYEYLSGEVAPLMLERTLYFLADHPNVVLGEDQRIPLTIKRGTVRFQAIDTSDGIQLSFTPSGAKQEYTCVQDNPTQFTVYKLSTEELELSRTLSTPQLIDKEQRIALERLLPKLRNTISVDSLLDIDTSALKKIEGQPSIIAHLLPNEGGYDVEFICQPIKDVDYFVVPCEGLTQDIVTLDPESDQPERVFLTRNFDKERQAVEAVQAACPSLGNPDAATTRWTFSSPLPTLNMLRELQAQQQAGSFTIAYPKGRTMRLNNQRDVGDLQLSIGQRKDWFGVTGNLPIDENRVLDFTQLLAHSREREGDFIQVEEGEYLEITKALQQRLDAMQGMLHARQEGMMLPQLAANSFAELLEDFDEVILDEQWKASISRAEKAMKFKPVLPKGFKADLREYQVDGFNWLMRLATWGVGACLADDMGLGKTIQALALLTARRKQGPALVFAPASVTRNWLRETKRFAPQLSPKLLANSTELSILKEAKSGELIIISYGLLNFVADDMLALGEDSQTWSTLILDEAQAIKNPATQRAKLLFQLKADFRLALTGTPIENNLTELWSLFRFLNPGLLGSLQAFTAKYTRPLARPDSDPNLAEQLRRLVHPFILRRRKDEVLKELPAKTETILEVVPDAKERALYEAIRREAVNALASATATQKRFVVLQQLMRLRQAACHPKLVRPSSKLSSAKLSLVAETIEELRSNGHRALVFSQFVKHLKLVEEWVKSAGISYLYLDGSIPGKKREQLVQEFQTGNVDLFLISLKAGGTGLNLTSADYVLHLDPWWNPAVEDQASDRAHRMGQQKPVTVYRFVTQGTIEESILALHAEKRDLADEVLRGSGGSANLSVEEMVQMLGA